MIESIERYKLLDLVGSGGLGEVYRARDTRVGRTVAIKVVTDQIVANRDRRQHFLRDARAATAVSHPNVVTLYDVMDDSDGVYLVYEFVQGQTLSTIVGGRPLNPRRAIDLACQIAEAIADAHAADVTHGDISAETIVVTSKGHAKVADFGLAGWASAGAAEPAPEPDRYRADIFSLGVVLFEMLTGAPPKPGNGVPSAVNRLLPREIDPVVAKALGKSGGYESAATLAAELRAIGAMLDVRLEASDAAAPPVAVTRTTGSYAVWMAVMVGVGLGALAAVAWWYFRSV